MKLLFTSNSSTSIIINVCHSSSGFFNMIQKLRPNCINIYFWPLIDKHKKWKRNRPTIIAVKFQVLFMFSQSFPSSSFLTLFITMFTISSYTDKTASVTRVDLLSLGITLKMSIINYARFFLCHFYGQPSSLKVNSCHKKRERGFKAIPNLVLTRPDAR